MMDQPILYRGRPFRLKNAGAISLLRRAVNRHEHGDLLSARRLVALAVRTEAGICTSAEAFTEAQTFAIELAA